MLSKNKLCNTTYTEECQKAIGLKSSVSFFVFSRTLKAQTEGNARSRVNDISDRTRERVEREKR